MTTIYKTREGDTVDYIAWRYYGATTNQVVEQVLAANRGLADYGPTLPGGVLIQLPDITAPEQAKGVKLWD